MSIFHHMVPALSPMRGGLLDWYGLGNGTPTLRANGVIYPSFASMVAAGKATFSRTGAGTSLDRSGNIIQFGTGVPRETNAGLLIEEARTNLALYSSDATQAPWSKTNVSVISVEGVSQIRETSLALVDHRCIVNPMVISGNMYSISLIITKVGRRYVYLRGPFDGNFSNIGFDLDANSSTFVASGPLNVSITSINDYFFLKATFIAYVSGAFGVSIGTSSMSVINSNLPIISGGGDDTQGFNIVNFQVETGSYTSSPIITTNAAATRGAESATLNLPASFNNVIVDYGASSQVVIPRSSLPDPSVFEFGSASGGPWVNTYIKRIMVL